MALLPSPSTQWMLEADRHNRYCNAGAYFSTQLKARSAGFGFNELALNDNGQNALSVE
ncbi:TPA: hypothetical protein O7W77_002898 [Salmonella enterica]|uniref:hypothetical protein n=1 Tax=Citrobacter freundii TaxID=546 RepID=UPI0029E74138|nr:hypothetical protein [Salmonella enterica]EIU2223811.1 hypothetical protein [Salmonella enterica]HDC1964515.1 hypothetical protein [Salmonella enterica]